MVVQVGRAEIFSLVGSALTSTAHRKILVYRGFIGFFFKFTFESVFQAVCSKTNKDKRIQTSLIQRRKIVGLQNEINRVKKKYLGEEIMKKIVIFTE